MNILTKILQMRNLNIIISDIVIEDLEMLVDLGQEVLENIVRDGVKEMFKKTVGSSRGKKQKGWFSSMKAGINEYQRKLKEDFLPVLVGDFSKKMVVKFNGGKMSEEDKYKIKEFMQKVQKSNIKYIKEELLTKLENLKEDEENIDMNEKVVSDGHQWILERLELHVRSSVSDAMFMKTVEKSKK